MCTVNKPLLGPVFGTIRTPIGLCGLISLVALSLGACQRSGDAPAEKTGQLIIPRLSATPPVALHVRSGTEQKTTRLAFKKERWQIIEPWKFPADLNRLQRFFTLWQKLRSEKILLKVSDERLRALGLTQPCLQLQFDFRNHRAVRVRVGCPTKKSFLAVQTTTGSFGRQVHIVKQTAAQLGKGPPEQWMSRRVFPVSADAVSAVRIQNPKATPVHLRRRRNDGWVLKSQWGLFPAGGAATRSVLEAIEGWRFPLLLKREKRTVLPRTANAVRITLFPLPPGTKNFSPQKTKDYTDGDKDDGKDTGGATRRARPMLELEISGPCPQDKNLFAAVRRFPYPVRFCISAKMKKNLSSSALDFLDRRVFRFADAQPDSIAWTADGKHRFALQKHLGTWNLFIGQTTRACEHRAIVRLLARMAEIKGTGFTAMKKIMAQSSVSAPKACIHFGTRADENARRICLYTPDTKRWFARRNEEPLAVQMQKDDTAIFFIKPIRLLDRTILSLTLTPSTVIQMEKDGKTEKIVKQTGSYEMKSPVHGPVNTVALSRLRSQLNGLRVTSFLDPKNIPSKAAAALRNPEVVFALEATTLQTLDPKEVKRFSDLIGVLVSVFRNAALETRIALGGKTASGGCYGRMEGMTFTLNAKQCRVFATPLISRRLFHRIKPHEVSTLRICREDTCTRFTQHGGKWRRHRRDNTMTPSARQQSAIRASLSALVGLRAVRVLSYSVPKTLKSSNLQICIKRDRETRMAKVTDAVSQKLEHCLVFAASETQTAGHKVRQAWVKNRPVLYTVATPLFDRLFAPVKQK
jgi:hypothetical protein